MNTDQHGHPMFYKILEELGALHSEKNRMYATKDNPLRNFKHVGEMIGKFLKSGINPDLAACLSLMAKQVDGAYEMFGEGKVNTPDSLEEKLKDIAVYSVIAMIINREGIEKLNTINEEPTTQD